MTSLKKLIYNIISGIPYKIHPSFHFKVYAFLANAGLGDVVQDPVVRFALKHIKKGDCVIDIGANQGTYSYQMLKAVGRQGVVYSFEPNPVIVKQLRKNLRQPNIVIEDAAVSSANEEKVFYRHIKGCGPTSSLEFFEALDKDGELEEVKTRCVTFDSFCELNKLSPRLIKIDVEGHEYEVIKGAQAVIRSQRPYIIFEFIEQLWEDKNINKIFAFLSPAYHLIRIEDGADAVESYLDYKPQASSDFRESRVVNIGCIPRDGNNVSFGELNHD